jgi:hypothetical protein
LARSDQGCSTAIHATASYNILILFAKSESVLDLICNRFAAELRELSVRQVWFSDGKISKEDPGFHYGYYVSWVKRDCVNH